MDGSPVAPAWHPDPLNRYELRFHNGEFWTADVSTNGVRYVDPLGATASPGPGKAIAALVLGIVSISLGWIPFVFAPAAVCGVLAITFGVAARRQAGRRGADGGSALAGIITGAIGLAVCVGGAWFTVAVITALDRYENPGPHDVEVTKCVQNGRAVIAEIEITNRGSAAADYSVLVEFVRPATSNADRSARVSINDVDPDTTATRTIERNVSLDDIECVVGAVNGPLPFGLDLG